MDVKIAGSSPGGAAFEKFKLCRRSSTFVNNKFDIYSKIFFRGVGNFFRHLCELVLRHQMQVSNYFVNSFYSVGANLALAMSFAYTNSISQVMNILQYLKLYLNEALFVRPEL